MSNVSLLAKWLPSEGTAQDKIAKILMKELDMTPRQYRKTLVRLRKEKHIVETDMCNKEWSTIKYEQVPSVAMKNYRKAFARNAPEAFTTFTTKLAKGEAKVNAKDLYPHEIVHMAVMDYANLETDLINAQWKALPDYFEGSTERVLPVIDVSGSMSSPAGGSGKVTCMDVSIGLGMYCAERNRSLFKDAFITFSVTPKLQYIVGNTLKDRVAQLQRAKWGMNTNLSAVFELILSKAMSGHLTQDDMPTMLLIISDMEFDNCANLNAMEMITQKYNRAGYKIPKIVFWNVNARAENNPVKMHHSGAMLVSGFSPSILKYIFTSKLDIVTPYMLMREVIDSERYSAVRV